MGQHYVPQHHLREFAVPEQTGKIWTYDKVMQTSKCLPIKSVAQEAGYYDEADEQELANRIEGPAIRSIATLRRQEAVNDKSRLRVSVYLASLLTRGPHRRTKGLEMYPEVLHSTISKFRTQFEEWAAELERDPKIVARWLVELEASNRKFAADPPREVMDRIRSPWPSIRYVELLYAMTWRVVASYSETFITSDNPANFFEAYGIGRPESEVCCPLSPNVALHLCWQGKRKDLLFVREDKRIVKEMNRRVATGAQRFVFSAGRAPWLRTVCSKTKPYLSRIQW